MSVKEIEKEPFLYGTAIRNGMLKMPDVDFENRVMMRLSKRHQVKSFPFLKCALTAFIIFIVLGVYISSWFTLENTIINEVVKLILQPLFIGFMVFQADQLWRLRKSNQTRLDQLLNTN